MIDPLHRVLIVRVAAAAGALSVLLGGMAGYLEFRHIDALVHASVEDISASYRSHIGITGPTHSSELVERTRELLARGFKAIRVYDANYQVVLEMPAAMPGGASEWIGGAADGFSPDPRQHDHHSWTGGALKIQLMIPIVKPDQTIAGFLEGVYALDPKSDAEMRVAVMQAAGLAVIIILLASAALYSVVISLNRGMLRLSGDLMRSNIELMEVLGSAIAKRDSDTDMHNYRVCWYSIRLAEALGVPRDSLRALIAGAFLHDVGKIGISDNILLKREKLNDAEVAAMHEHVLMGVDILHRSAWLKQASDVVRYHHERFDGTGYMERLRDTQIPLNARIFAIVDVFDALTNKRPYKEAFPYEEAARILSDGRGSHFELALVDLFLSIAPALFAEVSGMNDAMLRDRVRLDIRSYFFDARPELATSGCPAWVAEQCVRGGV